MKARRLPFEPEPRRGKLVAEQVIQAYRETGSIWHTAKRLGVCGQSVWERLRVLGYPLDHSKWTPAELEELRKLAGHCTIGEIATRFGRRYAGVACKISELQLGTRYGNRLQRKPRRAGYAKKRVVRLIDALEAYRGSLRSFCREHALDLEAFICRIQQVDRSFWEDYTRRKSDLTSKSCPYCGQTFYPLSKKQQTCSRQCSTRSRTDRRYFGGKRRTAIGLAEGVCQLCMAPKSTLSAHHVLGEANDPSNEYLVALCAGCHHRVGMLAGRTFAESPQGWENLINLVLSRRLADRNRDRKSAYFGVHACVDLEWL